MEEEKGREPFGLLKIYKLSFTYSGAPGRPRTKKAMAGLGENGVRLAMIRSPPAGLTGGWGQ